MNQDNAQDKAQDTKSSDFRDKAEKGVDTVRGVFASLMEKAKSGTASMQETTGTTDTTAGKAFAKGLEFVEQHVAAAFDHAQKVIRAPDAKEALKMQTDYIRSQTDVLKKQGEEMSIITGAGAKKPGEV